MAIIRWGLTFEISFRSADRVGLLSFLVMGRIIQLSSFFPFCLPPPPPPRPSSLFSLGLSSPASLSPRSWGPEYRLVNTVIVWSNLNEHTICVWRYASVLWHDSVFAGDEDKDRGVSNQNQNSDYGNEGFEREREREGLLWAQSTTKGYIRTKNKLQSVSRSFCTRHQTTNFLKIYKINTDSNLYKARHSFPPLAPLPPPHTHTHIKHKFLLELVPSVLPLLKST